MALDLYKLYILSLTLFEPIFNNLIIFDQLREILPKIPLFHQWEK